MGDGQFVPRNLLTFKVLVFDTPTQNLIATVMKVGQLRECCVALHVNIQGERSKVPDIPALYMIEPTP